MIPAIVSMPPSWLLLVREFELPSANAVLATLIIAFFVFWILRTAIAAIIIWKTPKWWAGKIRFSVIEAASALSGVWPSQYGKSERAQALANDLLGGVREGQIRVAGEVWSAQNVGLVIGPNPSKYPKKPNADFSTLISKMTLEALARNRALKLPWKSDRALEPPNDFPE